jgi:two-component system, chemotaxis family, chemotaxis protein CheY
MHIMTNTQKRSRVFIVDDNEVIRRLLSSIVRQDLRLEYVGQAPTGEAALQALKKTPADIVCLDVQMPGLDGVSVLEQMRKDFPDARVVMITGYATSDMVAKSRALGAAGFVIKPFNAAKVLETIQMAAGAAA